ncbi:MAG: hypothetical protein ACK45X_03910, partial [Roseiflexaceae bacterium]
MNYREPKEFHQATTAGLLTDAQKAFYDREGYLILDQLLSDAELEPARTAMRHKVDDIAAELRRDGKVTHDYADAPFETRLALLF